VTKRYHFSQSIEGALKNWGRAEWESIARSNGMTPAQVKKQFELYRFEGKKVIPFSQECEGFSYETGCPGHDEPPGAEPEHRAVAESDHPDFTKARPL